MYKFFVILNIILISFAMAETPKAINDENICIEAEIQNVVENYKGICSDWWEPMEEDYPSFEICVCFEKKFVETITEQKKRNLALVSCKYNGIWQDFMKSEEYKDFMEFSMNIWRICDKEVPRFKWEN